jgi:hypothetical protein
VTQILLTQFIIGGWQPNEASHPREKSVPETGSEMFQCRMNTGKREWKQLLQLEVLTFSKCVLSDSVSIGGLTFHAFQIQIYSGQTKSALYTT